MKITGKLYNKSMLLHQVINDLYMKCHNIEEQLPPIKTSLSIASVDIQDINKHYCTEEPQDDQSKIKDIISSQL